MGIEFQISLYRLIRRKGEGSLVVYDDSLVLRTPKNNKYVIRSLHKKSVKTGSNAQYHYHTLKCKWQMQHFCRSMMGYKNSPIFTPWMPSSKSISWLVQQYLPSDVVRACIKYNSSKLIESLFLYNCTSRWSCMYIMSVHYHPKGRDQIKKWTKN